MNGLVFSQRVLYMVSSFFEHYDIETLLGPHIHPTQLNDTVLGRFLDSLHAYGCTKLYGQLSVGICRRLGLSVSSVHMDSSSFHVDGVYNSLQEEVSQDVVKITVGYSRDHRPDLNQAILNLIVEHQAGIVLHMEALSGNSSDKTVFRRTSSEYVKQMQYADRVPYVIMDSAGYCEQTLRECGSETKWISRVPEQIKCCKQVVEGDYTNWQPLTDAYACVELCSIYGGVGQRWLLVFSEEAYKRELYTLKKNFDKQSMEEWKAFQGLTCQVFDCQEDAQRASEAFLKKCKYLKINDLKINSVAKYAKKGRPSKGTQADSFQYFIQGTACCQLETFEQIARKKGRFVLATNEVDSDILNWHHYKHFNFLIISYLHWISFTKGYVRS